MLFYRDGISESQFKDCIKHEISTIENAYRELSGQELQLTLIICGKRHNTRFYATEKDQTYPVSSKDTDKDAKLNGNLKPGLLVTKVVTNAVPENFFLQSHRAIKGTARSAHYHILRDDLRLGLKRASELTMMLCYVFSRATTGVSYVAPAYNAG
jgi:eukaryotic translation initiation factor 2C